MKQEKLSSKKITLSRLFLCFTNSYLRRGSSDPTAVVSEAISARVTPEMNQLLVKIPEKIEVQKAVFSIHPDKAPGPDGFSADFYQTFWDVIGDDVYLDIKAFSSPSVFNRGKTRHILDSSPRGQVPRRSQIIDL